MACGFGVVQRPALRAAACIAAGGRVAGRPRACVWVRRLTLAMSPDRFKLCHQSLVTCIALRASGWRLRLTSGVDGGRTLLSGLGADRTVQC